MKGHATDFATKNQVGILGVHVMQLALDVFVSVFLVARLFTVTDGDITRVGLFYLINFSTLAITFFLFSYIVKKFSRVWCIRASSAFLFAGIILVLLFQNQLGEFYLLLGGIYGIAQGIFWSSIHTFTCETLGGKKMASFAAWFMLLAAASRALFPLTLGAIVEFVNFTTGALIALGFCIIFLAFTLIMRDKRKSGTAGLSMRKFFTHIKREKISRPIWSHFWIQGMFGAQVLLNICLTILIVISFDNNFHLGVLTSIFAGVAVISVTIYKLIKSPKIKLWVYYITSFIPLFSAIGLLFGINPLIVIICQAGYVGFRVVSNVEFDKTRNNLMHDFGAEQFHTESLLFVEISYYIARVFVCVSLVAISIYFGPWAFRVFVFIIIATVPLKAILLRLWTKKYIFNKEEEVQL
jgi:MFS family permease